jgi:hypothetical protein
MATMTKEQKEIYINIRAEQIKYFQDKYNGHNMKNPFDFEKAKEVAKFQLESDLNINFLRLTLDELLLNDNDTCIEIAQNRVNGKIKDVLTSVFRDFLDDLDKKY